MRKLLVLLFVMAVSWVQAQSEMEMMAKHFAEDYYIAFQRIAEVVGKYPPVEERRRPEEAYVLEFTLYDMITKDVYGNDIWTDFYISNDIDHIFGSDSSARGDIPFSNYIGYYMNYAEQLKFSLAYEVVSCEQMEGPSSEDQFVKVVVDKTFQWEKKSAKVKETMIIRLMGRDMSIIDIENSYGTPK